MKFRTLAGECVVSVRGARAARWLGSWRGRVVGLAGGFGLAVLPAMGQTIVQEYYVPMPEAQIRQSFLVLAGNTGSTFDSVVSAVVGAAGTRVVYDHWEDGYEIDLNQPVQSSTRVWGDGNDANGVAPGFGSDPASLGAGQVIALRNLVNLPRNASQVLYDARDRLGATKGIVVSRSAWATTPGSVLADATEVSATIDWGRSYVMPIGEDEVFPAPLDKSMFEKVSLFVQAAEDGTPVQIDTNGDGTVDVTASLNRGESHYVVAGIRKGAAVNAGKPVQVHLLTGDVGANYESRWFNIPPLEQWGDAYFSPVGTASDGDDTYIFLYNPAAAPITVNYRTRLGAGSFPVPARNTYRFLMPQDSGAGFTSVGEAPFFAVGAVGAEPSANNVHDWGFSLVPKLNLTTELMVGWGPGSSDLSQNGSPVWVTPTAAARIYVDLDGDRDGPLTDPGGGRYDEHHDLDELAVRRIYDPDKDQTGLRVYTLDGTLITAAWGQDPAVAGPGNPYLDVGTTVPAFPVPVIRKDSRLVVDNGAPGPSIGDTLEYTITLDNRGLVALGNVLVLDGLPPQLGYVADSTSRDGTAITDDPPPGSGFPLDGAGIVIPILPRGATTAVVYRAVINAPGSIINTALTSYDGVKTSNEVQVEGGGTMCGVKFTGASGIEVAAYGIGAPVFVTLTDPDGNLDSGVVEQYTALVQNAAVGDFEAVTLVETAAGSGVFRNTVPLPSSPTAGLAPSDGTINAGVGSTLHVEHIDPVYGENCPDSVGFLTPSLVKPLYLSNDGVGGPDQDLDRIDPVASGDGTTNRVAVATGSVATIAVDAVSSGSGFEPAGPLVFNHTTGAGGNRLLLVGISYEDDNTAGMVVNSVSYAGQPLVLVGRQASTQEVVSEIWQLVNPPSGTAGVQVTMSGVSTGDSVFAGAVGFTGVDQTAPLGALASAAGTGTTATVNVVSAAGELVFDVLALDDARTAAAGAGQTQRWNGNTETVDTDGVRSGASTKPGAGSVTMSWTVGSDAWASCAVPVRPAVVVGGVVFTQTPGMAGPFTMPVGGAVTARAYVELASGSLPANPAISASLADGGGGIISMGNPVATLLSGGSATIVADATSSAQAASAASLSFPHTVGGGSNRLLLVSVALGATASTGNPPAITGVTYGGVAMNLVGSQVSGTGSSDDVICSIYRMTAPPAGAANVVVSLNGSGSVAAGASSFAGVNQTTPLGTPAGANGAGATASTTVVSAAGELVYGTVAWDEAPTITLPAGSGQTALWTRNAFGPSSGGASREPGAASVVHSYSAAGSTQDWAVLGVSIRPAQANAVYQLDWSGVLGAQTTVGTGDALALTVVNNEAGFDLLHDSASYPSQIGLPAETVIRVESVSVWDAPYPGGSLTTTPANGGVVYVRAAVTDPFGSYDITSLPLEINGPGVADDIGVIMGEPEVVSDDGWTKVYEYRWITGGTEGTYTITATGKEGLEDEIEHSQSTLVNLSPLDLGTPSVTEFTTGDDGPHTLTYLPDEQVCVRIRDLDQNLDPLVRETIPAVITSSSGDAETVILLETGPDTGVFTVCIPASAGTAGADDDGTLHAPPGCALLVEYVDPDDPTDTGSDTATVPAAPGTPGLALNKTLLAPADGQAVVGEAAAYRIRVTNTGSTTLATVGLGDTLPAQLGYVAALPAPDTVLAGELTWTNVGPLDPGESVDVLVDCTTLAAADPALNTAVADAGGGTTANDTAELVITRPRVVVTKSLVSPAPGPANKGDPVVFQITIENTGDTAIDLLPLEDTFSGADFSFDSAVPAPDGAGSGSLLWDDLTGTGSLAPGATTGVTVTLVAKGEADPAVNTAEVGYAIDEHGDPVPPAGDTATVETIAARISGLVLDDEGGSGFGGGDLPLPGVGLTLFSDPNGDGDPADGAVLAVTQSAVDGSYEFRNLGLGHYVVVASDPLGYFSVGDTGGPNDNRIAVDVPAFGSYPGNDFLDDLIDPANYGAITGQVRDDADADGVLADPEAGIDGATIDLFTDPNGDGNPADGVLFATTATSGGGGYSFFNVPPGGYVVVENDPPGFISTGDSDLPNDNRVAVSVASGGTSGGNDFLDTGNGAALGTLGNRVWSDIDNDGIFEPGDGETGIGGVRLELYQAGRSPGADPPYLVAVTSAGGVYQFSGVPVGDYFIFIPASNFAPAGALAGHPLSSAVTDPADNGEDDDDNGSQSAGPGTATSGPVVAVAAGESDMSVDFGFMPETSRGSIGGVVRVDVNHDGTPDGVIEGTTLTLLDAGGGTVATTATQADGSYLFDDLVPGVYSVVQTQPDGFLSVSDVDGGDPDLIGDTTPVVLAPGGSVGGRDFLERPMACPNTWPGWQAKWDSATGGQTGTGQNPDGDIYPNLIEYAFCMPPTAGILSPFCLDLSTGDPDAVDGVFRRTAGGATDVIYLLEYTGDLAVSPGGWTTIPLDPDDLAVTVNPNGTETVRIIDLEAVTGLTGGAGFVRMRVQLDEDHDLTIEAEAVTEVRGWVETPLGINCQTFNNPFLDCPVFSGTVGGVAGQVLDLSDSAGMVDLSTLLPPGAACYLEVVSGDHEGKRFDIVAAAGGTLTVAVDDDLCSAEPPHNTLTGPPPATLAGDTVVVRRHRRLGELFPIGPGAFTAAGSIGDADRVLFNHGGLWEVYWASDDGVNPPRWVLSGEEPAADRSGRVVPPGEGMLVYCLTAPVSYLAIGGVRANDFAQPLCAGLNLVAGGYPLDQSPTGRGLTLDNLFFGSRDPAKGDRIYLWNGDTGAGHTGYTTHYLLDAVAGPRELRFWTRQGDVTLPDEDDLELLLRDRSAFYNLATGHPGHLVPAPWTP